MLKDVGHGLSCCRGGGAIRPVRCLGQPGIMARCWVRVACAPRAMTGQVRWGPGGLPVEECEERPAPTTGWPCLWQRERPSWMAPGGGGLPLKPPKDFIHGYHLIYISWMESSVNKQIHLNLLLDKWGVWFRVSAPRWSPLSPDSRGVLEKPVSAPPTIAVHTPLRQVL